MYIIISYMYTLHISNLALSIDQKFTNISLFFPGINIFALLHKCQKTLILPLYAPSKKLYLLINIEIHLLAQQLSKNKLCFKISEYKDLTDNLKSVFSKPLLLDFYLCTAMSKNFIFSCECHNIGFTLSISIFFKSFRVSTSRGGFLLTQ